jgi:NodT family efflux transporter outer membrane factor (OMF) lipoprotein
MYKPIKPFYKATLAVILVSLMVGCSTSEKISKDYREKISTPETWQSQQKYLAIKQGWLDELEGTQVFTLVEKAVANNRQLQQRSLDIAIAEQQLTVAGSQLWPSLDLSLASSRRYAPSSENYVNGNGLDLNLSYELDIWGKLSAQNKSANLSVMAIQADYFEQKQTLVAQVVTAWFSVIEANNQVELLNERLLLTQQNLDIIESGYRQGLNDALDVYLTRNELSNDKSRLIAEQNNQIERIRELEILLGEYPTGELSVTEDLPLLQSEIPLGMPSELITRKPSLIASWYALLAKDADLAFAHKQRFPSLNLTGSIGPNNSEISELLSSGNIAWSLGGSLTAPLFNAGRLKANEEKALLELNKQELQYLDTLYNAFQDVENGISSERNLQQQYNSTMLAADNARLAQTLSFEQYLKGLVSYTTVLDAQKRSFDAQSSLISIKNLLIANRVQLHIALGGDFSVSKDNDNAN